MTFYAFFHRLRSMKKIWPTVLFTFFLSQLSLAETTPFAIPENDFKNPVRAARISNKTSPQAVTEAEFLHVARVLHRLFAPLIKVKGNVELIIKTDWADETVNAYATREVESWNVYVPGGIARASGMTKDSLALIICHELGHHLGGAPRTFLYNGWPSSEGQADYWATSKCLKRYYEELAHEEISIDENIPDKIIKDCSDVHKPFRDFKVCVRTMLASISFGHFLNELPGAKVKISIETPDTRMVKGTNTNDYPRPQCRLDTVYRGALCTIPSGVLTSDEDQKTGHCNDDTKPGTRPRCWFKP